MKYWSKIVLLFALIAAIGIVPQLRAAPGCSCALSWNPSSSSGVTGYAVYYGVSGSNVTNRLDVGLALTAKVTGLAPSTTYFFFAEDYDSIGDVSPPSNVLLFTAPPMSPLQFSQTNGQINIQLAARPRTACSVEFTPSLNPPTWNILTTTLADPNGLVSVYDTVDPSQPSRFYRGMIQGQVAPQVTAITGLTTTLQWNSSSSSSTIGYAVYYGVVGSSVTNRLDVGWAFSATISGLTPSSPYFFYVVPYDVFGNEGPHSNVILFTSPDSILPLPIGQSVSSPAISQLTTPPGTDNNRFATVTDAIDRIRTRFHRAPMQTRFRTA